MLHGTLCESPHMHAITACYWNLFKVGASKTPTDGVGPRPNLAPLARPSNTLYVIHMPSQDALTNTDGHTRRKLAALAPTPLEGNTTTR